MHTLHWPARDALVPIAIKVVDLERLLLAPRHRATFASAWNWADAYLRATLGRAAPRYRFLRQALPTPTPTLTLTLHRTLTLTLTLSLSLTLSLTRTWSMRKSTICSEYSSLKLDGPGCSSAGQSGRCS